MSKSLGDFHWHLKATRFRHRIKHYCATVVTFLHNELATARNERDILLPVLKATAALIS